MFMALRTLIDFDTWPMITAQHDKGHTTLVHILDVAVASVGVHWALAFLWPDSNPIRMDGPHKNKKCLLVLTSTECGLLLSKNKSIRKCLQKLLRNGSVVILSIPIPF